MSLLLCLHLYPLTPAAEMICLLSCCPALLVPLLLFVDVSGRGNQLTTARSFTPQTDDRTTQNTELRQNRTGSLETDGETGPRFVVMTTSARMENTLID